MNDSQNIAAEQARPVDAYTGRLGTRVALARDGATISSDALADAAGITEERLHHIEAGVVEPTIAEMRGLTRALNCGADYLLATRPCIDDCYRA
ncbi:helix-turn-helix domain-containing protein [Sorangium sp. So ce233]|uniref:helix-turn-helix domain-containing protein n=1 Tax=Sorangium sp. So ce233 TaxID=3133290 RepID=UPI003F606EA7